MGQTNRHLRSMLGCSSESSTLFHFYLFLFQQSPAERKVLWSLTFKPSFSHVLFKWSAHTEFEWMPPLAVSFPPFFSSTASLFPET